jgi:hypothetical protein
MKMATMLTNQTNQPKEAGPMRDPNEQAVIPTNQVFRAANMAQRTGEQVMGKLERAKAIKPRRSPSGRPFLTVPDYLTLWAAIWKQSKA